MGTQNFGPSLTYGPYNASGGTLFSGGNQTVVATALSAGLPTAYTGGLILYNPYSTTVTTQLVIQEVRVAFVVAQTNAAVIGLGIGYSTTAPTGTLTTVASVNQNPASSATATGVLYSSASVTLPSAPYLARVIGAVATGAETTSPDGNDLVLNLGGGIALPPGAFACILSSAAGTASSMLANFFWGENGG
jgi:hypothetical protein